MKMVLQLHSVKKYKKVTREAAYKIRLKRKDAIYLKKKLSEDGSVQKEISFIVPQQQKLNISEEKEPEELTPDQRQIAEDFVNSLNKKQKVTDEKTQERRQKKKKNKKAEKHLNEILKDRENARKMKLLEKRFRGPLTEEEEKKQKDQRQKDFLHKLMKDKAERKRAAAVVKQLMKGKVKDKNEEKLKQEFQDTSTKEQQPNTSKDESTSSEDYNNFALKKKELKDKKLF